MPSAVTRHFFGQAAPPSLLEPLARAKEVVKRMTRRRRRSTLDRETVTDQAQGVPLARIQELVRYWGTEHETPAPSALGFMLAYLGMLVLLVVAAKL